MVDETIITTNPKQPLLTILPTFWFRPLRDKGIPVFLDIFDFAAETPNKRFHEKPPLFIINYFYGFILFSPL